MKFTYQTFSCDVEIYKNESDVLVKFHDKNREQAEEQIHDLVLVDPGFGYINLKMKGKSSGLLSGYVNETIFTSDEMIQRAIDFVQSLVPASINAYVPHHVVKVKFSGYVEYNGEY